MLKVWLQETSGTVCPVSWMHFTVTCWQHLNHPTRCPHRWHSKLSWPFAHNVAKGPPKKSIAKSPRLVSHILYRFHQIAMSNAFLFFDASHANGRGVTYDHRMRSLTTTRPHIHWQGQQNLHSAWGHLWPQNAVTYDHKTLSQLSQQNNRRGWGGWGWGGWDDNVPWWGWGGWGWGQVSSYRA